MSCPNSLSFDNLLLNSFIIMMQWSWVWGGGGGGEERGLDGFSEFLGERLIGGRQLLHMLR